MSTVPPTGNFWIAQDTGQNTLRGVEVYNAELNQMVPCPCNPAVLPSEFIIDFLRTNKFARLSFNDLRQQVTDWTDEEIQRLDLIAQTAEYMTFDYQNENDRFQARQNTAGIYTAGPNGGRGGYGQ